MYVALSVIFAFLSVVVLKFTVFRKEMTVLETLCGGLVAAIIVFGVHKGVDAVYINSQTSDIELFHGKVTQTTTRTQQCPSGWTDYSDSFCSNYDTRTVEYNCRTETTGTGKNKSSRRVCDTKTQYNYDYDSETRWYVKSTLGEYEIDRVDRRGSSKPTRWGMVKIDDPVSKTSSYTNWLLVDNNAFEYNKSDMYTAPPYPRIGDYYNTKLVIDKVGVTKGKEWNTKLRKWLAKNAFSKQVNIIVHITDKPVAYFDSVMYQWHGGKKNDVNVFIGTDNKKPVWVKSTSFAKGYGNSELHLKIESDLTERFSDPAFWDTSLDIIISDVSKKYNRYSMENMQYIKKSIITPTWLLIIIQILGLVVGGGVSFMLGNNSIRER